MSMIPPSLATANPRAPPPEIANATPTVVSGYSAATPSLIMPQRGGAGGGLPQIDEDGDGTVEKPAAVKVVHALSRPWRMLTYVYSVALLGFSILITTALIFSKETKIAKDVNPAVALVVMCLSVLWLSIVEGSQGPLVGLPPVPSHLYKISHPISYKCMSIINDPDNGNNNLDRYLIGRQFLVVLLVFVTNSCGAPLLSDGTSSLSSWLPDWVQSIFLGGSIAMILITSNIGQLTSQVNGSHCMLDYINNYFVLFTLYVSLAIEWSGLLHSCYLVQMLFARMSSAGREESEQEQEAASFQDLSTHGGDIDLEDPLDDDDSQLCINRTSSSSSGTLQPKGGIFFWARVAMSTVILVFCFAVTLTALFAGKTTVWEGVDKIDATIYFFILLSIVGLLEGMQIAFFAVTKMSKEERTNHLWAARTCDLLFQGEGQNLPGFMIGRQICVTLCFFFIARVTTIEIPEGEDNIFGVSDSIQDLFNTGLFGAVITTVVGSIWWQLVASAFPVAYMSNPLVYLFLRLCLLLESTGICAATWCLAKLQKGFMEYQVDEEYIGTPEARRFPQVVEIPMHYEDGTGRVPHFGAPIGMNGGHHHKKHHHGTPKRGTPKKPSPENTLEADADDQSEEDNGK